MVLRRSRLCRPKYMPQLLATGKAVERYLRRQFDAIIPRIVVLTTRSQAEIQVVFSIGKLDIEEHGI
jgi:hypothetical protein